MEQPHQMFQVELYIYKSPQFISVENYTYDICIDKDFFTDFSIHCAKDEMKKIAIHLKKREREINMR